MYQFSCIAWSMMEDIFNSECNLSLRYFDLYQNLFFGGFVLVLANDSIKINDLIYMTSLIF